jgi:hypothetical protein
VNVVGSTAAVVDPLESLELILPAGSVRATSDVTAKKPRYYGRSSQSMLWRDVMCQKTSGNLGFSVPGVRKNRLIV